MSLFDMVFGCWCKRCSFPITARGKLRSNSAAASVTETYVVCLDCGHEFPYDWSQMKMLASKPRTGVGGKAHQSRSRSQGRLGLCWTIRNSPAFASKSRENTAVSWAGSGSRAL